MRYEFTEEQKRELAEARRKNKEKQTEKRLHALMLRAEGLTLEEVAHRTGYKRCSVSALIRKYFQNGLGAIVGNHCGGNRRNMSIEEEAALLQEYREKAEQGHMLDVRELKAAYEQKVGHHISSGQINRVLKRHGWRKVMPRSKHPQKASEEDIESSKKLKLAWKN